MASVTGVGGVFFRARGGNRVELWQPAEGW
jgi:hypothetical protein